MKTEPPSPQGDHNSPASPPRPIFPIHRRITARLDALQAETHRLEALYVKKLAALDALKSALLHQAFSGRI